VNSTTASVRNTLWKIMVDTGARNRAELLLILQTAKWTAIING
jgi:hypothetical protein